MLSFFDDNYVYFIQRHLSSGSGMAFKGKHSLFVILCRMTQVRGNKFITSGSEGLGADVLGISM